MDNPVLLQKQIKDNSEDLHNFVRELKLWEEEMKRKDRQLSNDQSEEILPPVRRTKLSNKETAKQEEDNTKKIRIPAHDYKSWEKFDVEKACEEIDNGGTNKNKEEDDEVSAEEEEKYLKDIGLYEKELGNRHVKACKWDEAILSYTKAINVYPRDPIFFANRALCFLKKKLYNEVEDDCTESLKLDSTYVKAYMRRSAAREALGRLEDARHDLYQVLQLEPKNLQAQKDLDRIKAAIVSVDKKKKVKGPVLKDETSVKANNQKKSVTGKLNKQNSLSTPPVKDNKWITNKRVPETATQTSNEVQTLIDNTVEPIMKPPHLRSKKSLKQIEIHDVGSNIPQHVCIRKLSKQNQESSQIRDASVVMGTQSGVKPRSILTLAAGSAVPPPPKTSVQFYKSWNSIKTEPYLCRIFLKQIRSEELRDIFKDSLEIQMLSSIVQVLVSEFLAAGEPVLQYLRGLSRVRRFSTIVLFMSAADKANLSKLFEYCRLKGECSHEDVQQLRRLYEMR